MLYQSTIQSTIVGHLMREETTNIVFHFFQLLRTLHKKVLTYSGLLILWRNINSIIFVDSNLLNGKEGDPRTTQKKLDYQRCWNQTVLWTTDRVSEIFETIESLGAGGGHKTALECEFSADSFTDRILFPTNTSLLLVKHNRMTDAMKGWKFIIFDGNLLLGEGEGVTEFR